MVPETHRILAGDLSDHLKLEFGVHLNETKLLRGSIAPDIYPKYKFIPHYYEESIDYVVENIVKLVPYVSEMIHRRPGSGLLTHAASYKIGVISHYLSDYMTHPHARRIRCTSMKDMWKHMSYEHELNHYVRKHAIDRSILSRTPQFHFAGEMDDLRSFVKDEIAGLVEDYLAKDITYENDAQSAYVLSASIFDTICEVAYNYGLERQVQMA
ncbi:MAG: zinc dependent phospholipase C family protein [Peptoniphilus sp.]|nr:zinc dependent phospholipase C family protein [Peptoniphilus sp.]MDD7363360.1 zinc dependent phospholipase C family protein [Bacillota bacterium]MDY6044279.1 zinc dependent phospholipase C family protein [Peptoniphilus sp.]